MLQEIQKFGESEVYSITLENEPEKTRHWFRATEVCKTLGHSDAHRAVTQFCKEWQYREFQAGKGRPALYICESGVYRLILRSKSKIAIEFQDWLTEEVLPKLRANGGYIQPTVSDDQYALLQGQLDAANEKMAFFKALGVMQFMQEATYSSQRCISLINEEIDQAIAGNRKKDVTWLEKYKQQHFEPELKRRQSVSQQFKAQLQNEFPQFFKNGVCQYTALPEQFKNF